MFFHLVHRTSDQPFLGSYCGPLTIFWVVHIEKYGWKIVYQISYEFMGKR